MKPRAIERKNNSPCSTALHVLRAIFLKATIDMIKQYPQRVDKLMNYARNDMSKSRTITSMTTPVNMTEYCGTFVFGLTLMNLFPITLSLLTLYKILV